MTTAREIMTEGVEVLREDQSLIEAAAVMRDHDVGALPVVRADGSLIGIVTDRDIVISGVATGRDLGATAVGALAKGIVSTVDAGEDVERIVDIMGDQQIKRLPVMDGDEVVGIISESDLARGVAEDKIVHFVRMVYGRG
ncbi:MAG: CBS domain-containing protein [Ornithinimicrobium sp.]|uniref:CBS domain-containing protein n=1 Tax=Ornithinimicrobium sp. TaxID=1977084 RepID=UPI0026DEB70E|nr:CBS domain-containing protein [Ornithinimicrobium sp.]MDO5740427.1 CBS domain-containing protein [Ornithinimicrobium sp.]